jgi:predicted ester cyclase
MSREREHQAIAGRWLEGFWGKSWTPRIVDDLAAADVLIQFSLQTPRRGREEAMKFLVGIREAFPDLEFHRTTDFETEGDYVVGRVEGGGTHAGPAFADLLIGYLPAHSGRKMRLTGRTALRIKNGRIVEDTTRMTWATALPRFQKAAA